MVVTVPEAFPLHTANIPALIQQQKKTLTAALLMMFVCFSPSVLPIGCVKPTKTLLITDNQKTVTTATRSMHGSHLLNDYIWLFIIYLFDSLFVHPAIYYCKLTWLKTFQHWYIWDIHSRLEAEFESSFLKLNRWRTPWEHVCSKGIYLCSRASLIQLSRLLECSPELLLGRCSACL